MSARKPTRKSPSKRSGLQKKPAAKYGHSVCEPLRTALHSKNIPFCQKGTRDAQNAYQTLSRGLATFPAVKRNAPLTAKQKKNLEHYLGQLESSGFDTNQLRALMDGRKISPDADVVGEYLARVDEGVKRAKSDPVFRRLALEARARCYEFERRWPEAISALREVIQIEDERLNDPVEAARTRTRVAQAYIEEGSDHSFDEAERLLLEGVNRIEKIDSVRRTKLELLLTLAHVHLGKGEFTQCQEVLEKRCQGLLDHLRAEPHQACYPTLAANYEVRLGVALKGQKDSELYPQARDHLIRGALIRARLKNFLGTAHAMRHVGGLYADSPERFNDGHTLRRALWFHLAGLEIFRDVPGETRNEARTHCYCGHVLVKLGNESKQQASGQRREMQSFKNNLAKQFEGEERDLVSVICDSYSTPHSSEGKFALDQPYYVAAKAHFEACIALEKDCEIPRHTTECEAALKKI